MKIAFPTNNEITLTAHFGRAKYFKIVIVEDGESRLTELRPNDETNHSHHHHHEGHHDDSHAQHNHHKFDILTDVDVIISGGMGKSAYQRLLEMKKEVWLVDEKQIQSALEKYISGELVNHPDKIH